MGGKMTEMSEQAPENTYAGGLPDYSDVHSQISGAMKTAIEKLCADIGARCNMHAHEALAAGLRHADTRTVIETALANSYLDFFETFTKNHGGAPVSPAFAQKKALEFLRTVAAARNDHESQTGAPFRDRAMNQFRDILGGGDESA